ncbi:MAG: YncE family protein [Thermoanaerobaculia bacterium]
MRTRIVLLTLTLVTAATAQAASYTVHTMQLPGGSASGISMDYIAFNERTNEVWVPAGNSGRIDVIDAKSEKVTEIAGLKTAEVEGRNGKRTVGPSSVSFGKGVVYIGNRAGYEICAYDEKTRVRGACGHLDSMPDGLQYVAPTSELWVTTPRDKSIRILDAASLKEKSKLTFEGNPEGFAVDVAGGRFFTNVEDKDRTLAIDLKTHKPVATWNPACGEDGPHGIRFDPKSGFLFVACSARVEVLDAGHDGKVLSSIDTGDGVDDIDYSPASHMLYVGAARAAQLVVASVDANGKLTIVATVPTEKGARNPAVTTDGKVFLAHGGGVPLNDLVVAVPAN